MKITINRKVYDTNTATLIASDGNDLSHSDFQYWEESLYLTAKGNWFLHGEGGCMSKYGRPSGHNSYTGSEDIVPLSRQEAFAWCEEHRAQQAIEDHFADLISEA